MIMNIMKKSIFSVSPVILLLSILVCFQPSAKAGEPSKPSVEAVAKRYAGNKDIMSGTIEGAEMKMARMMIPDKNVRRLTKNVSSIYILIYKDATSEVKGNISKGLDKCLEGSTVLQEEKSENGEVVKFYGTRSADGKTVKDLIMYAGKSGMLMWFFGTFSIDEIKAMQKGQ